MNNKINEIYSVLLENSYHEALFEDLLNEACIEIPNGYLARCPFHPNNNKTFGISIYEPIWHCTSCNRGGSWIDYLVESFGMSFEEAVQYLADEADIPVSESSLEHLEDIEIPHEIMNEANYFYLAQFMEVDIDD